MNITLIGALRRLDHTRLRGEFYRAWEVGLRNKLSNAAALDQIGTQHPAALEETRQHLMAGLRKGRPMSVVVKLRPELFPPLDAALLIAGDGFGTLKDSLGLLSHYYARDFQRMSRIRGLTAIPIVLGVVASFVVPFPLLWDVSARAYSTAIIGGVVALYGLGGIPISLVYSLSDGLSRIARPRFAWTLALGLEGGLTFYDALALASAVSGLGAVARHIEKFPAKERKTISLTQLLERAPIGWPALSTTVRKADEMGEYLSSLRVFAESVETPP